MKRTARNFLIYSAVAIVLLGAAAAGSALFAIRSNAVAHEGSLFVPRGSDYAALKDSLASEHRIRFTPVFDAYARRIGLTENVKPGHYVLKKGMNVIEIARMLNLGRQTPVNVVVPSVRMPGDLAQRVSSQTEADSASIRAAMRDTAALAGYGFANELELFSIFIPDTYEFWWTVSPEDFIARMKREYDRFWTPERDARRQRSGLSRMEVVTLASILCEETQKTDEMPTMAGVYINRLRKGMPLQADPTVKYAVGDFSLRRILKSHLKTESPYNTYLNRGLPPTPIRMPSIAAIDAVLGYRESRYLYFCAKEDFSGYHSFSETYQQHLQNARRYSAELNRRNIR